MALIRPFLLVVVFLSMAVVDAATPPTLYCPQKNGPWLNNGTQCQKEFENPEKKRLIVFSEIVVESGDPSSYQSPRNIINYVCPQRTIWCPGIVNDTQHTTFGCYLENTVSITKEGIACHCVAVDNTTAPRLDHALNEELQKLLYFYQWDATQCTSKAPEERPRGVSFPWPTYCSVTGQPFNPVDKCTMHRGSVNSEPERKKRYEEWDPRVFYSEHLFAYDGSRTQYTYACDLLEETFCLSWRDPVMNASSPAGCYSGAYRKNIGSDCVCDVLDEKVKPARQGNVSWQLLAAYASLPKPSTGPTCGARKRASNAPAILSSHILRTTSEHPIASTKAEQSGEQGAENKLEDIAEDKLLVDMGNHWQFLRMPSFRARCAICTLFYSLEDVHVIPCGHTFHKDCINTWLTSHHPHSQRCPVCRHRCGRHEVVKAFIDIDETAEGAAEHATDQLDQMRRELVLTKADALEAQRDMKRKVNDVRDEAARLLAKKDRRIDALVAQMKTVVQRRPPPPPQQQQPSSSKQPDVKAPERSLVSPARPCPSPPRSSTNGCRRRSCAARFVPRASWPRPASPRSAPSRRVLLSLPDLLPRSDVPLALDDQSTLPERHHPAGRHPILVLDFMLIY
ncbi:unnamed protein product, partial [Mesorhabditis spiculigera]